MKLANADIIALFKSIAETHPLIAHSDSAPKRKRFFNFNPQKFIDDTRSELNAGTLILGLSLMNRTPVIWNYVDTGTMVQKSKFFDVTVLGKVKDGDYDGEETVCANAEQVLEHILAWLYDVQAGEQKCDFPVVEYIKLDNVSAQRVMNVGVNKFSGAVMRLPLHDWVEYDSATNPLNTIES